MRNGKLLENAGSKKIHKNALHPMPMHGKYASVLSEIKVRATGFMANSNQFVSSTGHSVRHHDFWSAHAAIRSQRTGNFGRANVDRVRFAPVAIPTLHSCTCGLCRTGNG